MIFVTVGTHEYPFNRLIRAADELAGLTKEEVVIQTGSGTYLPQTAKHFNLVTRVEMESWLSQARVIISHAGAGTIIFSLKFKRKMVLIPRLAAFGEHMNDHQLQLAHTMERRGYAVVVSDPTGENLLEAIRMTTAGDFPNSDLSPFVEAIRSRINQWEVQKKIGRGGP